jgi:hypothetical protein
MMVVSEGTPDNYRSNPTSGTNAKLEQMIFYLPNSNIPFLPAFQGTMQDRYLCVLLAVCHEYCV